MWTVCKVVWHVSIATEWSVRFKKQFDKLINTLYAEVLQFVSKGRGLDPEQI